MSREAQQIGQEIEKGGRIKGFSAVWVAVLK